MVCKTLQNHCVFFFTFSCLHKECFKTFEFFDFSTLLQLWPGMWQEAEPQGMPSPGGKGVDHILLCPPERASLAPPPPATFLAIVENSKKADGFKAFLVQTRKCRKNAMVLEGFEDHNLITERLIQPNDKTAKRFLTF